MCVLGSHTQTWDSDNGGHRGSNLLTEPCPASSGRWSGRIEPCPSAADLLTPNVPARPKERRTTRKWRAALASVRECPFSGLVTARRSVGGRPLGADRVRLAAVSYALFSVGLFTVAGVAAGEALSAL